MSSSGTIVENKILQIIRTIVYYEETRLNLHILDHNKSDTAIDDPANCGNGLLGSTRRLSCF